MDGRTAIHLAFLIPFRRARFMTSICREWLMAADDRSDRQGCISCLVSPGIRDRKRKYCGD